MSGGFNIKKDSRTTPVIQGGIQTFNTLKKYLKIAQQDNRFYELEPIEVLEVLLDSRLPSFPKKQDGTPDYQYLGAVIGRGIITEQGLNIDKCKIFKPLNPNVHTIPVVGEVLVSGEYLGDNYYFSQINIFGNPSINTQHGLSKIKSENTLSSKIGRMTANKGDENGTEIGYYINKETDARRLLPKEGDVIIDGRFGNAIRLGSDERNQNPNSPNIILTAGTTKEGNKKEPVRENIDKDGSSIHLVTNQELDYSPAKKTIFENKKGKNILLSSDNIIFNTKNKGDVGMFSSNLISIGAVKQVVVETPDTLVDSDKVVFKSPVVKIGSDSASQPQVLGRTLNTLLNQLSSALITFGTGLNVGNLVGKASGLVGQVSSIQAQLDKFLSSKHRIDK